MALQVLAVLSFTRVPWPETVGRVLFGLSAFMLNVELTAPECSLLGNGLMREPAQLYMEKYGVAVGARMSIDFAMMPSTSASGRAVQRCL